MIVKTVIAVLEIKDVFFLLFFFFIALHQILCHFLSYRSIISAILSSRNRKPGAEKISEFYLLSDTKKRTPERMRFLSSVRFFLILLFLPSRFYRRG